MKLDEDPDDLEDDEEGESKSAEVAASKTYIADIHERAHLKYREQVQEAALEAAAESGKKVPKKPVLKRRLNPLDMAQGSERLYWLASALDDLEKSRTAMTNRIHAMFRLAAGEGDVDIILAITRVSALYGEATLKSIRNQLGNVIMAEEWAIRSLEDAMGAHPLNPFIESIPGLGAKQVGRLLGAIGDPYQRKVVTARDEDDKATAWDLQPRTVSALWAYCGLHVDKYVNDSSNSTVGVAPKRVKGQHSNWKSDARKRAWLVASSTVKSRCLACKEAARAAKEANGGTSPGWQSPPIGCTCGEDGFRYRVVFDQARDHYDKSVHEIPCVRCGPKGHPAPVDSPLSAGHKRARALRAVMKEVLKDLWVASRDWHLQND